MHLICRCGAGDEVDLDAEVGACFSECGVCCFGEDPVKKASADVNEDCVWGGKGLPTSQAQ